MLNVIASHCNHKCANVMNCVKWTECLIISLGDASSPPSLHCTYTANLDRCKYVFYVNISKAKFLSILDSDPNSEALMSAAISPHGTALTNSALSWALIRFRRKRKHFVAMQIFAHRERKGRRRQTRNKTQSRVQSVQLNPLILSKGLTHSSDGPILVKRFRGSVILLFHDLWYCI